MVKVGVVDCEGILVTDKTKYYSNKYKSTTLFAKKVALCIVDTGDDTTEPSTYSWTLNFPKWDDVPKNYTTQWKKSHRYHNYSWGAVGVDYSQFFKEFAILTKGVKLYAKGKLMEQRLVNNIGLFGESVCMKTNSFNNRGWY